MPTLEMLSSSIVGVGSFNPPLVSSEWLERNGLIGASDAEGAREQPDYLVSRQVTRFQTEVALIQIFDQQLSVQSVAPVSPALCDLACGILDLLPHSPVSAVGLNFMAHYKADSVAQYHEVGDTLAPKTIWKELFPDFIVGMQDLTLMVQHGQRDAVASPDQQRITIQPSNQIPNGIFLQVNDHHAVGLDGKPLKTAADASKVARKFWAETHAKSVDLFEKILQRTLNRHTRAGAK